MRPVTYGTGTQGTCLREYGIRRKGMGLTTPIGRRLCLRFCIGA